MAGLGLAKFGETNLRKVFEADPERFKDKILNELNLRSLPAFEAALRGDPPFEVPQRWAFRLLWEANRWVGGQNQLQIAIALFQQFGVRDEGELKTYVDRAKAAESVTLDLAVQEAMEILHVARKTAPELLAGTVCPCCGSAMAETMRLKPAPKRSRSKAEVAS